jgi:hypothetical protein
MFWNLGYYKLDWITYLVVIVLIDVTYIEVVLVKYKFGRVSVFVKVFTRLTWSKHINSPHILAKQECIWAKWCFVIAISSSLVTYKSVPHAWLLIAHQFCQLWRLHSHVILHLLCYLHLIHLLEYILGGLLCIVILVWVQHILLLIVCILVLLPLIDWFLCCFMFLLLMSRHFVFLNIEMY